MGRRLTVVWLTVGWLLGGAPVALAAANPTVTGIPVSAIEGASFTAEVGTYSGACGPAVGTTATVGWGDGTTAVATLAQLPGGGCAVIAAHAYAEEGTYTTVVTVGAVGAGSVTGTSTATVADAALKLTGATVTGAAGATTSATVATLTDAAGLEASSHYTATINWGDGHSSIGAVDAGGAVTGSNPYASPGTYPVTVTVTDDGGQAATAAGSATIAAATIPPCGKSAPGPSPPFKPNGSSPNARWIQAVYSDLLGRAIDPGTLSELTQSMLDGASREVIAAFLEGDPDRPIVVNSLYGDYLARAPAPSELMYWTQQLAGGATDEQVSAALLGSAEYYAEHGSTSPGFVGALYCDLLYRSIDQSALNSWVAQLSDGITRQQVAQQVLASASYRGQLVVDTYLHFLRHTPPLTAQSYWVSQLQAGATDQQLIASLTSSQEYFDMFSAGGGPTISTPSINSLGVIRLTLAHPATLTMRVLELLPAVQKATASAAHKLGPPTKLIGVVSLGHHRPGPVTIRWHLKIGRRPVRPGHYLLILQASRGHRLLDASDAIAVRLR